MGGTGIAKDVVLRALSSGKHVVTANKALIAEHLGRFRRLLGRRRGVRASRMRRRFVEVRKEGEDEALYVLLALRTL